MEHAGDIIMYILYSYTALCGNHSRSIGQASKGHKVDNNSNEGTICPMRTLAVMMDHMRDAVQNTKVSNALIAQNMAMLSPNEKKNASTV
jgi:hypothetical protein